MTKRAVRSVGLPPGAYYALTVLTLLNVINLWHRYLIVSATWPRTILLSAIVSIIQIVNKYTVVQSLWSAVNMEARLQLVSRLVSKLQLCLADSDLENRRRVGFIVNAYLVLEWMRAIALDPEVHR